MANQQLVDYLKEQLKLGAEKEYLKQSLLNVGWSLNDVEEAFSVVLKELNPENKNLESAPISQETSIPEVPKENLVDLTSKKDLSLKENIQKESVQKPVSDSGFISKDSFISSFPLTEVKQKEKEAVNETFDKKEEKTVISNSGLNNMVHSKNLKIILYVVFGILICGFLVLTFFLYRSNVNLQKQVVTSNSQQGDLEGQVQSLTKTLNEIQAQMSALKGESSSLKEESMDLQNQLLLFSQSTSSLDVTLQGKILLDKNQYVLKTNQDIIISIKNSKDAKVKEVLSSFVDNEVKVFGQRTPGLREITIKTINDKSLEDLISQKEAEKASTSTSSSASTTTESFNKNMQTQTTSTQTTSSPLINP
jgi:hypothetical protein